MNIPKAIIDALTRKKIFELEKEVDRLKLKNIEHRAEVSRLRALLALAEEELDKPRKPKPPKPGQVRTDPMEGI
jgi:hypothetical protein